MLILNCFEPPVRRRLARAGFDEIAANIERLHTRLLKQRQPMVNTLGNPSEEGVTIGMCFVLWQAGLHRTERLLVSAGRAVGNNDVYGLAVLTRALLESTAVIAAMCALLHKWAEGDITYADFDTAVTAALAGSRSSFIEESPQSTNILTQIKHADRFINEKHLFPMRSPLSNMYDVLSEYAHPNMTSNSCAFEIDGIGVFRFNHGGTLTAKHLDLIGALASAAQIYATVSDFFHGLLVGENASPQTAVILPWPAKSGDQVD
ncbi:MAG: hypothetical protein Q8R71_01235 [Phenylobacterium sp.]|nr:hypothetical protein [Phenylobacterium sp.]